MKHFFYLLFSFILLMSYHSVIAQQDRDLHNFYAEKLKANGLILPDTAFLWDYADVQRLLDYNFDSYRSYNTNALVAIKSGPVLELMSITDMIGNGKKIDDALIESKKQIASMNYKHAVMPIVDVQFGYKAPIKSKEKTTIFMTPKDARR